MAWGTGTVEALPAGLARADDGLGVESAQALSAPARGTLGLKAVVVALGISGFLVSWGVLHYGFYTHRLLLDTPIYERYGDAVLRGSIPYRDFALEYPPGALPVFVAPAVVAGRGHFATYTEVFEGLMGLCGAIAVASVSSILLQLGRRGRQLALPLAVAGMGSLALGPVVLSRFDLWPASVTVAAIALLLAERRRLSFAAFGLAFAAKLFPIVLLPPMLVYVWRRHGRRPALAGAGVFGGVSLACFAPFLALSPHGVLSSLSGQAGRPLQIESLGASLLLAAHQVFGTALTMGISHGSNNLVGPLPHALALAQAALQPLALVALWLAFARGPMDKPRLLDTCAACVCAFIAFGKVFSPQYLVWLLPLVPLVGGRRGATASAMLVLSMALTQLWFPYRYLDLAYAFDPTASWLVVTRDLVLVALLAVLAWPSRADSRIANASGMI